MAQPRCITLLGIKHVGKTSISRELARRYRREGVFVSVVDTDRLIIEIARTEVARTGGDVPQVDFSSAADQPAIRRLYHTLGRSAFLELEARAIRETADRPLPEGSDSKGTVLIVATGGGIVDNPEALNEVERLRPLLYLWNDPAVLYSRIVKRGRPAFLTTADPEQEFLNIAEVRDRKYRRLADRVVDVSAVSVREAARIIHEQMR